MKKIATIFFLLVSCHMLAQGINNAAQIVVNAGGYVTVDGANAKFTNAAGGSIDNDGLISVDGEWSNNAANAVFTGANDTGEVLLNGTTAQVIGGTSATSFEKLTLNNAAGVSLQQPATVTTALALTSGVLALDTNTLTVNKSAPGAISRTSGYIISEQTDNSGKIAWNLDTVAGTYTFPFGTTSGDFIPFTLTLESGSIGIVTVSTYPTGTDNLPLPATVTNVNDVNGFDNSGNTVDRFWQIDKTGTGGVAALTFTATNAEVGTISGLRAQRWNSVNGGWDAPLLNQSATATSVTVPDVTAFSPWTLSGNNSTLPVELLYFTASVEGEKVNLSWMTSSEINNDYFAIERTRDGISFETIAIIDGAGNSTQPLLYLETDTEPFGGISYYRLKQVDFNGAHSYSSIVAVEVEQKTFDVAVFPNPATEQFRISARGEMCAEMSVVITDIAGRKCFSSTMSGDRRELVISKEQLPGAGMYTLVVTDEKSTYTEKIIVQ